MSTSLWIVAYVAFGAISLSALTVILSMMFRKVVSTNMVHIVQSKFKTTPYGTGQASGNVYYKWPSFIPHFGITVIELAVSNFDLSLQNYEAYDKDRVPFMVDVAAFFRISNTALAAQRVFSINELKEQLKQIVQGAVRKVLASDIIDVIMLERAQFGDQFSEEIKDQLTEWGVESVKSMELMDIRDSHGSEVITNIMAKKTSHIEMESRCEVANNTKKAQTAEIEAQQTVDLRREEAEQAVGKRQAEKNQAIGVANEESRQDILTQEKTTKERDIEVRRVEQVKQAEITKDQQIVLAEQEKQTLILVADGELEAKKKEAEGIEIEGKAKAEAEMAMQLAPVEAQIKLAKEIGSNDGYQQYLAMLEAIKAYIEVGTEQAKALQNADVKVISNSGTPTDGAKKVLDLFSSTGGTQIGSMIEGIAQSPMGKGLLSKFGIKTDNAQES